MHFRKRGRIFQVIRTEYDASTKRPKATIVGRISIQKPALDDDLKKNCTADELQEVERWLKSTHKAEMMRSEFAARTLAEQLELATEWFLSEGGEDAAAVAAQIVPALAAFRRVLRQKDTFA